MKQRLKTFVGDGPRRRLERLGRLRYDRKLRNLRSEGVGLRRQPLAYLSYLLLDPELHSYSYDLDNRDELARFIADLTDVSPEQVVGYLAETDADPELNAELSRRLRGRFDYKRRMPLGNRMLWYALVRALKPGVIAETGIHDGLGSLVLLRALERNAGEGHDGALLSFDIDPEAGWLVPDGVKGRYRQITGPLEERLEPALAEAGVDLLIHDSDHNEQLQRLEFGAAIAHGRSPAVWMVDASGLTLPVLRDLCAQHGGSHHYFRERPRRHFYATDGTSVARVPVSPPAGGAADA